MSALPPAPPRFAAFIARRVSADPAWREIALGDLHEEFDAHATTHGVRRARWWYRCEVARLILNRLFASLREAAALARGMVARGGDTRMRTAWHEMKFAARALLRQPRVTLVVILTLALGLGANAAVFGMVDSLLLHPFTIRGVDRLVMFSENSESDPFPREAVSAANYLEWRDQGRPTFDRMASFEWWNANLSDGDRPARVQGHRVTADFFEMLGVTASRGRLLEPADEAPGAPRHAVISDALWRTHFGAAPDIVGRAIRIDGQTYDVIGVTPPGFDFPFASDVWAPIAFSPADAADRTNRYLTTIARLSPGTSFDAGAAAMQTIYARQRAATPDAFRSRHLVVRSFAGGMRDEGLLTILLMWQVAAVVVLIVACTNVANLLLAQGAAREREMAVRTALGAGRARLVRQLLAEGLVLALVSVPIALALAAAGFVAIRAAMPPELTRFIPGWDHMGVDWRTLAATTVLAAVTAVIFGAIPALRSASPRVGDSLRGSRSVTAGVNRSRLRRALVIAEVAIALPLLVLSGLAVLGAHRFASGPQGYDPDGALRLRMILSEATYPDAPARRQFVNHVLERLSSDARVAEVATTSILPAGNSNQSREVMIEGRPVDPDRPMIANYRAISPAYLQTLRIPIVDGRGIEAADRDGRELVAVISQSMARRWFPGGDAIGRQIRLGLATEPPRRIVGISGDTIDDWFIHRESPTVFVPVDQSPSGQVCVVLRPRQGDPSSLTEVARAAVASVDPGQPMFEVMTMRHAVHVRTTGLRFVGGLMAVFAAIALLLAAIGLYGVMSAYVAQRRREIGIRMALGAGTSDVLRQTIGQAGRLALVGTVVGLALAIALSRLMESAMFGIIAVEAWLFVAIAGLLLVIAIAASLIPARQAALTGSSRFARSRFRGSGVPGFRGSGFAFFGACKFGLGT